jgi:hypothetical protein
MDTSTGTSTPSGSTETPSSGAPTTAAPSPSITPGQRPTFEQAFAADAASTSSAPSTDSESATTQPVDPAADPSALHPKTDAPGPIPFAAHKTALENARTKAAQEAQQQFDRDYGWAKQIPRESLNRMSEIASQMTSDPIRFLNDFVTELQSHPTHAQALRSQAGRLLASARGPQAEPMPGPDVQIVDAQGQVTGETYSAAQLAKRDAWREQQLLAKVQQEFGPLKAERDQQRQQAQADAATKQVESKADGIMSELTEILDGDESHFAAVKQVWDANPSWSAHQAALHVRKTVIAPSSAQKAEAKVLEDLKTKAASQGVNPAGAVVANTSRPTSFNDPRLKWS